jgi:hypothetical protein
MNIRETYLAAWNETDRDARTKKLSSSWDSSATYVDPLAAVEGIQAISDLIGAVQHKYPGLVFTPVGDLDSHHDVARFNWGLGLPGEEPAAVGFDVVTTSPEGRIRSVAGFIDKLPG